ncbi:unnamed protein product, partial [Prorocentrum cordatum]
MAQFVSSDEDAALARRICLRLLAAEGHVPAAVWGALVCAHARDGDADAAFALLSRLEARGGGGAEVPPLVFEELIEGLVRDRRLQAAFDTFQRMRAPGAAKERCGQGVGGDPWHPLPLFVEQGR